MAKEEDGEEEEEEEEGRSQAVRSGEGGRERSDDVKLAIGERRNDLLEQEVEEDVGRKHGGSRTRRKRVEDVGEGGAEEGNVLRQVQGEEEEIMEKGQGGRRRGRKRHVEEDEAEAEEEREREGDEARKQSGRRRRLRRNGKEGQDGEGRVDNDKGNAAIMKQRGGEEDEDEANADLSLHIVAKAEQRRKRKTSSSAMGLGIEEVEVFRISTVSADSGAQNIVELDKDFVEWPNGTAPLIGMNSGLEEGELVDLGVSTPLRNESPEEGELQGDDADVNPILAMALPDAAEDDYPVGEDDEERAKRKKKKKREKRDRKEKKEKRKRQKGGAGDNSNDHNNSRGNSDKRAMVVEIKDGDAEESMVMRKLLRGPRYFDPPEDQGQSCFTCGKMGHLASACPEGPRLKPCYVCGGFGHDGRECPQKTECYVCGKVGHIAKNCPNKGSIRTSVVPTGDICLLCGHQGHEASNCYNSYDAQDLDQVQCYICKKFGHLSCVIVVDTSPLPVSCYDCGEMGHTGAGCARPRRNDRERDNRGGSGTASVCFKCGEEGHYARGCSKRSAPWPAPWPLDGGFSRSADRYTSRSERGTRWMDIQQREPRWTPARRLSAAGGDRWTGSRVTSDSPAGGRGGGAGVSPDADEDIDSYMGPIENFAAAASSQDGYRKRRKRIWTSTLAR